MSRELMGAYMQLIAAKATAIAEEFKRGRTFASDVRAAMSEIIEKAQQVSEMNRSSEAGDR